ncbi:MAG TPA: precorrin-8X methylmutase [Dehalococcoidia bacterium]|nr:precorrin-8X methylmutase [Dehalococcoidia bacterium]
MSGARAAAASLVERYALPPDEIERRSLGIVAPAVGERFADPGEQSVATRVVYAAGDLELARSLRFSCAPLPAAIAALRGRCHVVTDVRMVAAALDRARLQRLGCELLCAIDTPGVAEAARGAGVTRSLAGIRLLAARLDAAVVVIGNAPTALLGLLDLVDAGTVRPACVIGMPVGFVAAAEAKAELLRRHLPAIAIEGTRGGSAVAAAALNVLLRLALDEPAVPLPAPSEIGGPPR